MKKKKMIKLPRPMRIVWGSLGSWWLAYMINPGFESIALMMVFYIPVLIIEHYYVEKKAPVIDAEFLARLKVAEEQKG